MCSDTCECRPRKQCAAADGSGECELPHSTGHSLEEIRLELEEVVADPKIKVQFRETGGALLNQALDQPNGSRAGYIALTYATAKAAVIHLTKCVAVELGPYGVRVNSLSPGPLVTGIDGKAYGIDPNVADREEEAAQSAIGNFVSRVQPLRGIATSGDIARTALFLASDASRFITAHDLVVDGGITAGRTQSEMMANSALLENELGSARRQ